MCHTGMMPPQGCCQQGSLPGVASSGSGSAFGISRLSQQRNFFMSALQFGNARLARSKLQVPAAVPGEGTVEM